MVFVCVDGCGWRGVMAEEVKDSRVYGCHGAKIPVSGWS